MTPKKQKMIDAMIECDGNVTAAVKKAKIARRTHYTWLENDPEYKQAVEDIDEKILDFAEEKLREHIRANDKTCLIFFLKTKGKSRGYVERTEQHVTKEEKISEEDAQKELERLLKLNEKYD